METMKYVAITILMLAGTLAGCEEGPLEEAGEAADSAVTDMRNAVEDSCENLKEEMKADNPNC